MLRTATQAHGAPVVLLLDQFEQFFVHHKTKSARRPFVQQMTEWSRHSASLPAKIVVSIRGDFADRLHEL